ncbi:MAG: DUF86 domain-containing protein [Bacteroidales bacterium]|nr:DUF86 domain-containing protein [Bacteroidales bacterium]
MAKKRDITIYLEDIIESADLISEYLEGYTEQEFISSKEKQDAVLRRIQIVGEAAKHIDETYREKWSHIPWRDIAGMRDIVVHEYFGVTLSMVWKVATEDIPILREQISKILKELQ